MLKKYSHQLVLILIFTIPLIIYSKTLLPGPEQGDIGELQAAAYTLGIAHPSGYPVYVILGKLFTFLPFGPIPWRVNFMSAFFSSFTIVLIYLILIKLTNSKITAFLASLILAFSNNFWYFSLVAQVYSLNVFFIALFILWYLNFPSKETKIKKNSYFWFFFLLSIGQGNHRSFTALTPIFLFFLFLKNPKFFLNIKRIFLIFTAFFLGLSIYLYIPLRSLQSPYLNYAHPNNWKNFKYLVTSEQFHHMWFAVPIKTLVNKKIPWFYQLLLSQFYWAGLFLASIGLISLMIKRKFSLLFLLTFSFLANTLICLSYNSGELHRYFMPSFLIVSLMIGLGIGEIFNTSNLIKNKIFKKTVFCFLIILFSFYPFSLLKKNCPLVDQSKNFSPYYWGVNTIEAVKPGAIIMSHWNTSGILWSTQACYHFRPDVFIADERVITDNNWGSFLNTAKIFSKTRPIYLATIANHGVESLKPYFRLLKRPNNIYELIPRFSF